MLKKSLESLIRSQDWEYSPAGRDWRDGLLLGNGDLAAVACAPAHLEWVLNKIDVFDPSVEPGSLQKRLPHQEIKRRIEEHTVRDARFLDALESGDFQRNPIRETISAGILRLRFWQGTGWAAPAAPLTSQHLNFFDGILQEEMNAHDFHPRMEMFIPRNRELFCLRISENAAPDRPHILELLRPANGILPAPLWRTGDNSAGFQQKLPGGKHRYAVAIRMISRNDGVPARAEAPLGGSIRLFQRGDADIFISVKSSFRHRDPLAAALAEVGSADTRTYDCLKQENSRWWHDWWNRSYADFGKYTRIQKYYTFSLYELACSFGKAPMPGLNGLAFGPLDERTPGAGYQGYTHDQNAQIPALPLAPLNHADLTAAVADTYLNIRGTLRRETRKLFHCPGIFLPLTMNQLGLEYATQSYRYTLCGSAYTGMVLAKAWRFSHDRKLLEHKIYPLLREFTLFYASLMTPEKDGRYHLDWSVPPEIFTFTRDENATTAMFKIVLETTVEAARILNRDRRHLPRWKDILDHYPEIPRTPNGAYWCGPDIPRDHYFFGGHLLYPFFPAGIDQDRRGAEQTLELIGREAVERSYADLAGQWHPNHEWSMFLITSARIRLGDRKAGWEGLNRFLDLFAKENGLFTHDPILIADPAVSEANENINAGKLYGTRKFCDGQILTADNPEVPHPSCVTPNPDARRLSPGVLEGSSSFLSMAAEILIQSQNGIIRLFPCVPEKFTGSFRNLAAEGGFLVSAEMKNGTVTRYSILARDNALLQLRQTDGSILQKQMQAGEILMSPK